MDDAQIMKKEMRVAFWETNRVVLDDWDFEMNNIDEKYRVGDLFSFGQDDLGNYTVKNNELSI